MDQEENKNIFTAYSNLSIPHLLKRERSGSVVECLTQDQRAGGLSLTGVTASLSKTINPNLVLVQPRKTNPFITERLLMGSKESNQANKNQLLNMTEA